MESKKSLKFKIETDEDFINYPRYLNSIEKLLESNPNGVDNKKISKALMIEESEVEEILKRAISKIRNVVRQ